MILFVLIITLAVIYNTHAVTRHGTDALIVRECMNRQGPLETWTNLETNRDAHIVCLPDGKFGIQVCDQKDCEITSFIKEKLNRVEQVYRYLRNRGYEPIGD
jgi:hypothetical protein